MNFKRLTAAALSATMLLSAPFTAYADETGGGQKEIGNSALVDNKTTVSVPVTATINSSFTVSLPSKMELTKDALASFYSYSGLVGVKGDIDADAVVKVKPDKKVTMYDVTYRPAEVQTTPTSVEEQSGYVHKQPTDVTSSQPVTTWQQSELSSPEAGSGYTLEDGYHNTDFGLSVASLSSGKWEGIINFNINYESTYVAPGLYDVSGNLTKSWVDLVSDGAITVSDNTITGSDSGQLSGKLVISDDIDTIGADAFDGCTNLSDIIIPESVTSISLGAFDGTAWLTAKQTEDPVVVVNNVIVDASTATGDVVIPSGVTEIKSDTFNGCAGITSVSVPDSVTVIGENAFESITDVYYKGTATGSPWGATNIYAAIKLTEGTTYTLGGYEWVCAETDGNLAVMQSTGVTAGGWPGREMGGTLTNAAGDTITLTNAGKAYNKGNIDGYDISNYDDKTEALYTVIKGAEKIEAPYGKGLFLVSNEKVGTTNAKQGSGNYWSALLTAAAKSKSFSGPYAYDNAWIGTQKIGTQNNYEKAWSVSVDTFNSSNNTLTYNSPQDYDYVIAPAFNLDTSKITLEGNAITVKAE